MYKRIEWLGWIEEQTGQDLAEYSLLMLLVALAVVGAVAAFGDQLAAYWWSQVVGRLPF